VSLSRGINIHYGIFAITCRVAHFYKRHPIKGTAMISMGVTMISVDVYQTLNNVGQFGMRGVA